MIQKIFLSFTNSLKKIIKNNICDTPFFSRKLALIIIFLFGAELTKAEIKMTNDFSIIIQEIENSNDETLVLFDVAYVLTTPKDKIMRPCGKSLRDQLFSQLIDKEFFLSLLYTEMEIELVDNTAPQQIDYLIHHRPGIKIMALTSGEIGRLGVIPDMVDWKVTALSKFGFNFKVNFESINMFQSMYNGEMAYKDGILFSGTRNKGDALRAFLEIVKWKPIKVIAIDDSLKKLKSIQKTMSELNIPFTGFQYTKMHNLKEKVDERIALYQFKYLTSEKKWIKDSEVK